MTKLKNIFAIIEEEDIILEETNFIYGDSKGIYFKVPNLPPTIGIEKSIPSYSYLYLSVLAEELGHHFTTYGNLIDKCTSYPDELMKNKKENIAKLWAANFLISDDEFKEALLKCYNNKYDLCEYFNITRELLDFKILSLIHDEVRCNKIKNSILHNEVAYETCCI